MNLTKEQIEYIDKEVYSIAPFQPGEDQWCAKRRAAIAKYREQVRSYVIKKLLKANNMSTKNVRGVQIDIDAPKIKEAQSPQEIKSQGFFSHLSADEEDEAVLELWQLIHPDNATTAHKEEEE